MFAYCENNPVVYRDVTGYFLWYDTGAFTPVLYRSGHTKKCELYIKYKSSLYISGMRFGQIIVSASNSSKKYGTFKNGRGYRSYYFSAQKSGYAYIGNMQIPLNISKVRVKITNWQVYRLNSSGWFSLPNLSGIYKVK